MDAVRYCREQQNNFARVSRPWFPLDHRFDRDLERREITRPGSRRAVWNLRRTLGTNFLCTLHKIRSSRADFGQDVNQSLKRVISCAEHANEEVYRVHSTEFSSNPTKAIAARLTGPVPKRYSARLD